MPDIVGLNALALDAIDFPLRGVVVAPWLRTGETAVIWAAAGVGKTFLSLSLALAVAGGGTIGDWSAPKPRKVLYLDAEMNADDMQERIRFLLRTGAVKVKDREKTLRNLKLICNQYQKAGTEFFDLTDRDHHEFILERAKGFDLLILDNLTTMSAGMTDENAASEFKAISPLFMTLKQAGIATILVHHSNKSGSAMRGSTALEATFEVILGLKKPAISKPGSAAFEASFSKFRARGDTTLAPSTWRLSDDGWLVGEVEPEEASDDPVVKAVRSFSYVNQQEVADAVGMTQGAVCKRLARYDATKEMTKGEVRDAFATAKRIREDAPEVELVF